MPTFAQRNPDARNVQPQAQPKPNKGKSNANGNVNINSVGNRHSLQGSVPLLTGFYYAIADAHGYRVLQLIEQNAHEIKVRQFKDSVKVLPDYLVPDTLVIQAQFWLSPSEFASWQPLLVQRGVVSSTAVGSC